MNLFDRFLPRYSKSQVVQLFEEAMKATQRENAGWLSAEAEHEKYNQPDYSIYEQQANLYRTLSWVQMAVGFTANAAASVAFSVKKLSGEEESDIPNHPFELRLTEPNELNSRAEFLTAVFSYRLINGNAYVWLNRPSENVPPIEMWVIPSSMIKPVPDGRMYLKGYLFDSGDGKPFALEPWEVVHYKSFHPLSSFRGLSPIEAIATVATGDLEMQKWNTKLFGKNNARLPGILAFADPITDPEWEKIKSEVDKSSRLRQIMMMRNVGKGVNWMQAAASQKDMEFLGGRTFTKEEIFNIYAPGLASMLAVNATEANALAGRATFADYTLWPLLDSLAQKITLNILPSYGDNLKGEFDDVRFADRKIELEESREFAKTHTIDEIRREKYGDDELGDDRGKLLPAQIAAEPVGLGETPEPKPAPAPEQPPKENEPIAATEPKPDITGEAAQEELKRWERFAISRIGKKSRSFETSAISQVTKTEIETKLKNAATPEEIKAIFARYKNRNENDYEPLIAELHQAVAALREAV